MMTPREELIQAIQQSSDEIVWQLLTMLKALEQERLPEVIQPAQRQTILERMGGVPQYLLSDGNLSDRNRRRNLIAMRLQQKYRQDS